MGNNKMGNPFKEPLNIYLIIMGILVGVVAYYDALLGFAGVVLLMGLVFFNWYSNRSRSKKWRKYIEKYSMHIDNAARYAVFNLPVPLVVVDIEGKINWYNSKFTDLLEEKSIMGKSLGAVVGGIQLDQLQNQERQSGIKVGDRIYDIYPNMVALDEASDSELLIMLYWFDTTDYSTLKTKYEDEKPVVAMINVDNYEDVMNETKEDKIPFVTSEIEKKINLWATRMNGMIKKYQNDKYLVIFEHKYLEHLEAKRFSIVDEVREIDAGNKIPVTLSIGIGINGTTPAQLEEDAYASLELALGRGGDQAVLRKKNAFEFYGGKTKAVEKRNRVKARVIAHGFRTLVDESARVIVMGHRMPDMDSFGAAVGVYRSVINRGKEAYIVLNTVTDAILNVHENFKDNSLYRFIDSDKALELLDDDTLVVVVDTHKPSLTECPELVEQSDNVVVIDHHRRSTEFIEKAVLKYLEPYASSTSELIAELIQYMENKPKIEKEEADALLAGITVDTKNFSLKTGVRTFDAAAYLRRQGADTIRVRQLFQDDLETFIDKATIVGTAIRYRESIAISTSDISSESIQLIAAQAADDLLNIRGINASFVIAQKTDGMVIISGRSLGEVNVQVILESLGGGGHLEVAGAQFEETDVMTVKEQLIHAIDEYFEEGVVK
ncbi:DHH family phosphoesterase [Fusibacter tunisiensis]|uniref:Cyclic-di-AMP phosphodiesterase n=1 Tax=Fusibacter tunisiensis TaxID=1008308 RepID=A0ABS2MNI6_9FIRM|nr:DHH family phosphoesterase [Fusibacter tunisiensis]MBM7560963.1 c-di-AMP phosphodiesterase-like protein [Fusibacter tunisiensis]